MRHTHYLVQAYETEDSLGNMTQLVTLDLIAKNENEAISKAQQMAFGRSWYRVASVMEHDPDLEEASQASEPLLQQLKDGELTLDRIQIMETGEIKVLPELAHVGRRKNGTS